MRAGGTEGGREGGREGEKEGYEDGEIGRNKREEEKDG